MGQSWVNHGSIMGQSWVNRLTHEQKHVGSMLDNIGLGALSILGAGPVTRKVRNTLELECLSHVIDDPGVGQAIGLEESTHGGHDTGHYC